MIYKFLDIPNYSLISNKIYDYVLTKTDIMTGDTVWNETNQQEILNEVPELKLVLDNLQLKVERHGGEAIAIVKADPGIGIKIHMDYDTEPRILWPIRNCQGSYTKFFKVNPTNIIQQRRVVDGSIYNYLITDPESAKQIDSLELTAPVVFTPWIPHGVWCNPDCNEPRLTMTIKFNNNTDFGKDLEKYNIPEVNNVKYIMI